MEKKPKVESSADTPPTPEQSPTPEQVLKHMEERIRKRREEQRRGLHTTECTAYLEGIYDEFALLVQRYASLTSHMREMEARVELTEKTLSLTRDHLAEMIDKIEFATPKDW